MRVLATVLFYAAGGWLVTQTTTGRWLLGLVLLILVLSVPIPR
ncbi:hypothetical protein ACA040_001662 [Xenophilus aerolatus]